MNRIRNDQAGMTLVEIMVALVIFGLVSTACVGIMRLTVQSNEALGDASDRLRDLTITRSLVTADLVQMVNRVPREADGTPAPAAFVGGAYLPRGVPRREEGAELLLALVRNGQPNPDAAWPRSSLQYVEYWLADDRLIRRSWAWPDRQEATPMVERVLLRDLSGAAVRFFDGIVWQDRWVSSDGLFAPRAVALDIGHPTYGQMEHLFFTGLNDG